MPYLSKTIDNSSYQKHLSYYYVLFAVMSDEKPYCLMPWIHLHIGDDGIAKACCVANIPFGNINKQEVKEIWDSKAIQSLRSTFKAGKIDKRCANCYKLEESGATSIRQETHKKFKDTPLNFETPTPIYFDIRFSNVCNLKCRSCWHGASSSWFEDAKKLRTNKGQKAIIKNITDFDRFISKSGPYLLHAQEFYFAGGEPLVMEEHYRLLKWLIKNEVTKIKLRYNTNFTLLKYKGESILDLWRKFENIQIMASLDAQGETASYIRTNSNWESIVSNFKQAKKLSHLQLEIAPTISVLNVELLPELIQTCLHEDLISEEDIYINLLERPIHYNIQIIPLRLKERVSKKLSIFQQEISSIKLISQIDEIIRYMNAKDQSKHWPKFISQNKQLDDLRNETLPSDYYEFD